MSEQVKPGYKQTEVGVIPDDWDVGCVGNAFEVCDQLRFPISQSVRERISGSYPYYGPTGVQGWINEFRVEGKYALIGEDGDHFLKWNRQSMTLLVRGQFNVNNHAHIIRGTKNLTEWFYWYFSNRDITPYLKRQGAGRYKLTKAVLLQLPCAVPPFPEQEAIAEALSDADALIAALEQLIAKKRRLKQGAMQALLTGQQRLPGFEVKPGYKQTEVGLIPVDWESSSLSSIISSLDAGVSVNSVELDRDNFAHEESILKTSCVAGGFFFPGERKKIIPIDRYRAKLNPRKDSIIISRMNTPSLVGESGYIAQDYPYLFLPDRLWLTRHEGRKPTNIRWLAYILSFSCYSRMIKESATGTSESMKNISKSSLLSVLIPFPTKAEQEAIATILSDMDTEIATLEAKLGKARQIKQGMMQELLTGKIRLMEN